MEAAAVAPVEKDELVEKTEEEFEQRLDLQAAGDTAETDEEKQIREYIERKRAEVREAYAELGLAPEMEGIVIDGKLFDSPGDFTIGEAEVVKDNTGMTPQELLLLVNEDNTDPSCLRALAWVVLHRADGKTSWDDERITKSSVGLFFKENEVADGSPPGSRQKRS